MTTLYVENTMSELDVVLTTCVPGNFIWERCNLYVEDRTVTPHVRKKREEHNISIMRDNLIKRWLNTASVILRHKVDVKLEWPTIIETDEYIELKSEILKA